MRGATAVALVAVLALAGCSGPLVSGQSGEIGVENGVRYDDPLSVTPDNGLNATERKQVKSRAMARLERLRGLEFTADVPVRVVSRSEYRNRSAATPNRTAQLWNNQVWEGLFLVGEGRNVSAVFDSLRGSTVQGYYTSGNDEIVIVSDSATPRIRRSTLVHELVHALQDQQFGIGSRPNTQDRQIARNGVVEGEAVTLTGRYERRCEGEWDCVSVPGTAASGGGISNLGVFFVLYQPYRSGPRFVDAIEARGGWDAVDALHDGYPASSEQIIHPDAYPDEEPVPVDVPDRSTDEWRRFDHDPVADTVGEASMYAMIVANGVGERPDGQYSYEHPVSVGWGGDSLVPYRAGDRFGYVWMTAWDTPDDARQFHEAYRELLRSKGAVRRGDAWVIEEGPFADAFRVTRERTRVRIVNAPTVEALSGIHTP